MTNTTHIICLTKGNEDFTYGGLHEVVKTGPGAPMSLKCTSNSGRNLWIGVGLWDIDYHPVTNSNILNAYAECVQAGKLAWEDVPAEYRGEGMKRREDERKLVAVTCPDVGELPPAFGAGERYTVTRAYTCGEICFVDGVGHEQRGFLENDPHLNGADWIPHYDGDVIQGFGEYRTRGGDKATITEYRKGTFLWAGLVGGAHCTWTTSGVSNWEDNTRDIIGPWNEGDEDHIADVSKKVEAQEIPATEAIKRLLDGEVIEFEDQDKWLPLSYDGTYMWGTLNDKPNSVVKPALSWFIKQKWRIPTPETFGKEEARKRLLAGEKVRPMDWSDNFLRLNDDLELVTSGSYRMSLHDFPDDQQFVEVK